jgi:hypothetical protein
MIQIRHVEIFDKFELPGNLSTPNSIRTAKEKKMTDLKQKLGSGEKPKTSTQHYLRILLCKEHAGHPVGENASVNQAIDKRIIELAKKNVTGVKEVKRCLDEFVAKELFSRAPKHT